MRAAILADIHSNLEAFTAVLEHIKGRGGADEIWCLGDVVGYGPDPHECIELLRGSKHICIAGNHDWAALEKIGTTEFNPDAAAAARWTAQQLAPEDVAYLESLPLSLERDGFTLAHGSPREPLWEYLLSTSAAIANYDFFATSHCLVGHSHIPLVFKQEEDSCTLNRLLPGVGLIVSKSRLIINPGGVGQPRDGNPEASYAIYDSEVGIIRLHRVPYDIEKTQEKMVHAGLPLRLAIRLKSGV